jgi:hypothetical protein
MDDFKKYTLQAKRGIKGEAFFESLVSDYCLPHHIVGPKDLGIDYICQWVYDDKPTSVLYAAQVKTFSKETAEPKSIGIEKRLNLLEKYQINNSNLTIDKKTLLYWKTLGMPVYLFAICDEGEKLNCYYKRFTPILTQDNKNQSKESFYKVNRENIFIAFADPERRIGGFARDLFIDYIRWNYYKGSIAYLNPRDIGLAQFPDENIFPELFQEYQGKIIPTYIKTKSYIEQILKKK